MRQCSALSDTDTRGGGRSRVPVDRGLGGLAHPEGTLAWMRQCTVGHRDKRRREEQGTSRPGPEGISTPTGDSGLDAPVHRWTPRQEEAEGAGYKSTGAWGD